MRRLAAVVVIAFAGFAGAMIKLNAPGRGCPLTAYTDHTFYGTFVGNVSVNQTTHIVRLSHNGQPLAGAEVCVNTEMIGMTGMSYSAKAQDLSDGRYQVGFRFEMAGDYRTNLIARRGSKAVSIPLTVKVGTGAIKIGGGQPDH
jgi:hypothetical protein